MLIKSASLHFLPTIALVEATPLSSDDLINSAGTKNLPNYYSAYGLRLDETKFQVDQPAIGIFTMPFWSSDMKPDDFPYTQFIWEHNANFIHYAGSWAVPIRYDI
jgi:hypothetical protein